MNISKWFRQRTPLELAAKELDEAKRELLVTQSGKDYATRMVEYHQDRIKRLNAFITRESEQQEAETTATKGETAA